MNILTRINFLCLVLKARDKYFNRFGVTSKFHSENFILSWPSQSQLIILITREKYLHIQAYQLIKKFNYRTNGMPIKFICVFCFQLSKSIKERSIQVKKKKKKEKKN